MILEQFWKMAISGFYNFEFLISKIKKKTLSWKSVLF